MLRNLLQAAAWCKLAVAIVLLLHCLAEAKSTDICPKTLWRIDFNDSFSQGEALLRFDVPYQDKVCG